MAIIQFEDLTGDVEIIAMGDDFDKHEELLTADAPFLVTGRVRIDKDEDRTRVSVRLGRNKKRGSQKFAADEPDVISLHEIRATKTKTVEIKLDADLVTPDKVQFLSALFGTPKHEGNTEVRLRLRTSDAAGACDVLMKIDRRIQPSDDLHYEIKKAFDGACELSVTA